MATTGKWTGGTLSGLIEGETLRKLEPDAARKIRHMIESLVRNRYEIVPVDGSVVLMRAGEPAARFNDVTKAEAVYARLGLAH